MIYKYIKSLKFITYDIKRRAPKPTIALFILYFINFKDFVYLYILLFYYISYFINLLFFYGIAIYIYIYIYIYIAKPRFTKFVPEGRS